MPASVRAQQIELSVGIGVRAGVGSDLEGAGEFGEAERIGGLALRQDLLDAARRGAANAIQDGAHLGIPRCIDGTEQTHGSILSRLEAFYPG